MKKNHQISRMSDFSGLKIQNRKINFYDPSQARDDSGRWTGSGSGQNREKAIEDAGRGTTIYHGTSANVLKKIRESGLEPSKKGVYGRGVYATDNQKVALEYGCLKMPESARIGGKLLIGLVEVVGLGFEKVYQERKKTDSFKILLSKGKVPPSAIKTMKIFDAKSVRKWIFEGGKKPAPLATKNLEEGIYYVPVLIDESEVNMGVEYVGSPKDSCPVATQDIKTNLKNRKHAVDDASYGPANPKEPNEEFWKSMAKNFNTNVEEAKTMRCGNCAAFNKTSRMLACIKKGIGEDSDEVAKAGDLGLCEFFDFKCASLRTCSAWVVGGPITDKDEKKDLDCGTGAGGFKSGNTCAKGGGSAEEKVKRLVEQIKKEDPKADVGSELVRRGADSLVKAVSGAAVKATYGVTKAKEIAKWIRSSEGQKFMGSVASGLRLTGAGAIGALRGIHNARFKILVSGLINPALVPYFVSASAMKGFFDGAVKEYRNEGGGRQISNAIRSKIGIKPMQAFVQTISLQAKNPPIEDVVAYLTDVLRVSIDEVIDGKRTFEITSFYDPSQARDESGKWTSTGGSGAIVAQDDSGKKSSQIEENGTYDNAKDQVIEVGGGTKGLTSRWVDKSGYSYLMTKISEGEDPKKVDNILGSPDEDFTDEERAQAVKDVNDIQYLAEKNKTEYKVLFHGSVMDEKDIEKNFPSKSSINLKSIYATTPKMDFAKRYASTEQYPEYAWEENQKPTSVILRMFRNDGLIGYKINNIETIMPKGRKFDVYAKTKMPDNSVWIDLYDRTKDKKSENTAKKVNFYDPSQARDESGKWTGGGATASQVDPERVQAIEKELRATGYEVDTVPRKEEMAELKTWAKSLAEKKYTPEDAERIAVGLKDYASPSPLVDGGFRDVNKFLRGKELSQEKIERSLETLNALQMAFDGGPKYDGDVVYRGSKSSSVYEGIKKSYTHNVAKNIREGSILSNKGFFSATKSEDIANEFAGYMPKKSQISMSQSQIFMKISNAKNKGIVMPLFAGIGREKEVLFPEKTKIKVTKVKRIENNAPESWVKRGIPKTYATFIEGEIL